MLFPFPEKEVAGIDKILKELTTRRFPEALRAYKRDVSFLDILRRIPVTLDVDYVGYTDCARQDVYGANIWDMTGSYVENVCALADGNTPVRFLLKFEPIGGLIQFGCCGRMLTAFYVPSNVDRLEITVGSVTYTWFSDYDPRPLHELLIEESSHLGSLCVTRKPPMVSTHVCFQDNPRNITIGDQTYTRVEMAYPFLVPGVIREGSPELRTFPVSALFVECVVLPNDNDELYDPNSARLFMMLDHKHCTLQPVIGCDGYAHCVRSRAKDSPHEVQILGAIDARLANTNKLERAY